MRWRFRRSRRVRERELYEWGMREHRRRMAEVENPTTLDELRVVYEVSGEMLKRANG